MGDIHRIILRPSTVLFRSHLWIVFFFPVKSKERRESKQQSLRVGECEQNSAVINFQGCRRPSMTFISNNSRPKKKKESLARNLLSSPEKSNYFKDAIYHYSGNNNIMSYTDCGNCLSPGILIFFCYVLCCFLSFYFLSFPPEIPYSFKSFSNQLFFITRYAVLRYFAKFTEFVFIRVQLVILLLSRFFNNISASSDSSLFLVAFPDLTVNVVANRMLWQPKELVFSSCRKSVV